MPSDKDRDNPFVAEALYLGTGTILVSTAAFIKIVVTQKRRFKWLPYLEDCLLLLAVAFTLLSMTMVWTYADDLQVVRQTAKNDQNSIYDIVGLLYAFSLLTIWTHATIRLSFLLSLRRVYSPIPSAFNIRSLCDALMCIECAAVLISTVWVFTAYWHQDAWLLYATLGMGGIGVGLDVIIFLCGLPLVWKLKDISQKRKMQMMAVMGFGFLTLIPEMIGYAEVIRLRMKLDDDPSNHLPSFITICQTETILSILTVCIPSAGSILAWVYADRTQTIIIEPPPVSDYFSTRPASSAKGPTGVARMPPALLAKGSQDTPFFTPAPFTNVDLTPQEKVDDSPQSESDENEKEESKDANHYNEKRMSSGSSGSDSSGPKSGRQSKRNSGQMTAQVEDDGLEEILVPSDRFFPLAVNPRIIGIRTRAQSTTANIIQQPLPTYQV